MGSATISDQEFERLHNQLLEVKSQNYLLDEQCRRHELDLNREKQRNETLEKELNKYQNLAKLNPLSFAKQFQMNKNKDKDQRDKEVVEHLQMENEHLQRKIQSQEDDFRLTNQTLRDEINHLIEQNKQLNLKLNGGQMNGKQVDKCALSGVKTDRPEIELIPCADNSVCGSQMSYAFLKEKEQLEAKLSELNGKISQLEQTNQSLTDEVNELKHIKQEHEDLERKVKELNERNESLVQSIDKLQREKTEFRELAEKRLLLIDELRSEVEEMGDKMDAQSKEEEERIAAIKSELHKEIYELKGERKELGLQVDHLRSEVEKLQIVRVENAQLHMRLEAIQKLNVQMVSLEVVEQIEIDLNEQLEQWKQEAQTKEEQNRQLQQHLEDQIEERKIHERRGVMYVRELKKQLNNEKKQKERLQEKFGDLLSEMNLDVNSASFETTSVGSWSFLSSSKDAANQKKNSSSLSIKSATDDPDSSNASSERINSRDSLSGNTISGVQTSGLTGSMCATGNPVQNQVLEQENTMLVARLTQLQQEKWTLEERLNQLTILNEEISNELQNKQKIISFYCMERRSEPRLNSPSTDKFTVKKVVDFIKDKGDDNLKEINRKLQRMLEETLIKNMHLQTNLETLSKQLHEQSSAS